MRDAANILEARDKGDTIDLYINGQLATSIKDTLTPKGGVPGLYSGDAAKIGFKRWRSRNSRNSIEKTL